MSALGVIGFSEEEISAINQILATILLLVRHDMAHTKFVFFLSSTVFCECSTLIGL